MALDLEWQNDSKKFGTIKTQKMIWAAQVRPKFYNFDKNFKLVIAKDTFYINVFSIYLSLFANANTVLSSYAEEIAKEISKLN